MYSLILFDMDDTVFDFEKAEKEAFYKTFEHFKIPHLKNKHHIFKKINLSLWRDLEKGKISPQELRVRRFEKFLLSVNEKQELKIIAETYISFLKEGVYLVENSQKVLAKLKKNKIMAIITNGLSDVQNYRLKKSGLLPYFEKIFISEDIGFSKPDPRFFVYVIKNFKQIKKKNILVVGDNISSDIKGAYNCGLDSVWFNPKNKQNTEGIESTYEIKNLTELLNII